MRLSQETHANLTRRFGSAYAEAAANTAAMFGQYHPQIESVFQVRGNSDANFDSGRTGAVDGPGPPPRPSDGPGTTPEPGPSPGPGPSPTLPCPDPTLAEIGAIGAGCEREVAMRVADELKDCERKNPNMDCVIACSSAGIDIRPARDPLGNCGFEVNCNIGCTTQITPKAVEASFGR